MIFVLRMILCLIITVFSCVWWLGVVDQYDQEATVGVRVVLRHSLFYCRDLSSPGSGRDGHVLLMAAL
uniref:Secreted protein n=1 Tax=Trichogramma kaykai TaxID=54128 RepID=A0ABD2WIC5_9HYME